MRKERYHVTQQ